MRGTKDGGVDVVATKNLGPSGYFKGLGRRKNWRGRVERDIDYS